MLVAFSFCGCTTNQHDMTEIEHNKGTKVDIIREVFIRAEEIKATNEYMVSKEGKNYYLVTTERKSRRITKNDSKYIELIEMLEEVNCFSSFEWSDYGFRIWIGSGVFYYYDRTSSEVEKFQYDGIEWEKTVSENNIVLKGRYDNVKYNITMKNVEKNIYIAHVEKKYPWYVYFIG